MGFDLLSETGEELDFSNSAWRYLVEFAAMNGFAWPVDGNGDDKEALTSAEATEMANAITHGLGDGPAEAMARRASQELSHRLVQPTDSAMFRNDPIQLNEKTIEYWKRFVAFARRGGFSISF